MAAPKGNKYAVGANNGRPPKYKTAKELIKKCDEYFTYIEGESHTEKVKLRDKETGRIEEVEHEVWDRHPEPPTVTGLALFLGFASKQSLYDYNSKEDFSYPIKRSLMLVENYHEKALGDKNPTGHIFALKNKGWSDKVEIETTKKRSIPAIAWKNKKK